MPGATEGSRITKLEPGKRYRVTAVFEGVANAQGTIDASAVSDSTHEAWSCHASRSGAHPEHVRVIGEAATVELIEPEYIPGHFYRDADGDVVLRLHLAHYGMHDEPWLSVGGPNVDFDKWWASTPRRPLVELKLTEA